MNKMLGQCLFALPFVAGALATPLEARTVVKDFSIYAYGSNITGLPVIAINNMAYLSAKDPSRIVGAHNVTFDSLTTRGNFTAKVNGGGQSLLYVPSTSGPVGLTNSTDDASLITTGFGFYGHVIFLETGTTMLTEWYAVPSNETGLWQLSWNEEGNGVPVALRNIGPTS